MTIEEYLRKRIEDLEEGPCNSSLVQGKILAYREVLEKLPGMEHEVTLRETLEMCQSRFEEGCEKCSLNPDCCIYMNPTLWNIDEIERRMKEARND